MKSTSGFDGACVFYFSMKFSRPAVTGQFFCGKTKNLSRILPFLIEPETQRASTMLSSPVTIRGNVKHLAALGKRVTAENSLVNLISLLTESHGRLRVPKDPLESLQKL